jgi:hypothetical protein
VGWRVGGAGADSTRCRLKGRQRPRPRGVGGYAQLGDQPSGLGPAPLPAPARASPAPQLVLRLQEQPLAHAAARLGPQAGRLAGLLAEGHKRRDGARHAGARLLLLLARRAMVGESRAGGSRRSCTQPLVTRICRAPPRHAAPAAEALAWMRLVTASSPSPALSTSSSSDASTVGAAPASLWSRATARCGEGVGSRHGAVARLGPKRKAGRMGVRAERKAASDTTLSI